MTNYGHHAGTRAWSNGTCYVATLIRETNGNPFAHEKWRNGSISRITGWMKNRPTSPPSRLKRAIGYYCKRWYLLLLKFFRRSFRIFIYGLVLRRHNSYNFLYNKFSSLLWIESVWVAWKERLLHFHHFIFIFYFTPFSRLCKEYHRVNVCT